MTAGRPPFVATRKLREQVQLRRAAGWPHDEIATEIGISHTTLTEYFAEELRLGSAKKRGEALDLLWKSAKKGNVSAQKALVGMMIKAPGEDRPDDDKPSSRRPKRALTLGKKEIAQQEAQTAGAGTDWGDDLSTPSVPKAELN